MKKTKTKYTILIVCEGTNTETNYFHRLKEQVIESEVWPEGIDIKISPKPPFEEMDEEAIENPHKSKRRRRQLKNVQAPRSFEMEAEYRAFPVNFVREAQKGLEDGVYDEAWAVFDKDYHPQHQEAFELAENLVNGNKVNIAFSSISFEHWCILHFEKNDTPFEKSECKVGNKSIKCGSNFHEDDCGGTRCASGYLVAKGHLPNYGKSKTIDLYSSLKRKNEVAFENASWLRFQNFGHPIFSLNPYTDVDFLVKKLLRIDNEIKWVNLNEVVEFKESTLIIRRGSQNNLSLVFSNLRAISHIFNIRIFNPTEGESIRRLVVSPEDSSETQIEVESTQAEFRFMVNSKFTFIVPLPNIEL